MEDYMANRKQHLAFGAAAGAAGYVAFVWIEQKQFSWAELLGYILGGSLGAMLPDMVEPATHPNHRSFFHSQIFAVLAAKSAWEYSQQIRQAELQRAEECVASARLASSEEEASVWRWQASCHSFFAGLLPGLVLGYGSHLAADAVTPKSLPLLC